MTYPPAPWKKWGHDLGPDTELQMEQACSLPIALAGALMPDAHIGYGLPIGGVLATDNAVIPYGVGVDIACRMALSIYNIKPRQIAGRSEQLKTYLQEETAFGIGAEFKKRRQHEVMDADWSVSPVTRKLRDKAWAQLGTSGSGNHFVEFGHFTMEDDTLGFPAGDYVALLSHSGSRGTGAQVCNYYSRLAMDRHPDLPKALKRLAWLSLDEEAGQEYWAAMNLMGQYAAANHDLIHHHIAKRLGEKPLFSLQNHHNFAWKERHTLPDGIEREVIVHRKGATPAGKGVLGIIPGSMASPAYVVEGRGVEASLQSAAHGAGRVMSRSKALQSFTWSSVRKLLKERHVELISAGLDEVPGVYKNIDEVMAAQTDLVAIRGRFIPRIVKMSPPGEKPED